MAFLDNLKRQAERKLKQSAQDALKKGINKAVTNMGNKSEKIVIADIPQSLPRQLQLSAKPRLLRSLPHTVQRS